MRRVAMEEGPESEGEGEGEVLALPQREFTYPAGGTERPFEHFVGRWKAIQPKLTKHLKTCGSDRPLRVVDVGSCTGYFSLQAAYHHPEADIVALEGSVGIGNGTVGVDGGARNILVTGAVQTHLRWIQRLGLPNCFVAPEVWDYARVCELAALGKPICDAMFLLSVVHHIDNVSVDQYKRQGMSKLEGFLSLMGKILTLSPAHFIELPARPWLTEAYDTYGTSRQILEACVKSSGLPWRFSGPIFAAEWFGHREVWQLEVGRPMPTLDLQSCPFPLLYRGEERELQEDPLGGDGLALGADAFGDGAGFPSDGGGAGGLAGEGWRMPSADVVDSLLDAASQLPGFGAGGRDFDPMAMGLTSCPHLGGTLVDPGLMLLHGSSQEPVTDRIAQAVATAPTQLLVAHLTLREAISEAEEVLREVLEARRDDFVPPQRPVQAPGPVRRGLAFEGNPAPVRC